MSCDGLDFRENRFYFVDTIVDDEVTKAFADLFHPVQMDRIRFVQMDLIGSDG